ncbi:hypothetical protein [Streptomyces flavofungini]|uniref:hypothetical protein n=1 Tax=Streptomyces flavofungini TaxID=68200 RepID=UPI0025AF1765|nr:hypothetical protein [Streptomyces flavofungini]WJV49610.1 hypothetical protein QUY26_31260 [Streptomyces flavofungini]
MVTSAVKPWSDEVSAIVESDDFERFDAAHDRVPQEPTLVSPSGAAADFLLRINGSEAWFRWSDEPFGG